MKEQRKGVEEELPARNDDLTTAAYWAYILYYLLEGYSLPSTQSPSRQPARPDNDVSASKTSNRLSVSHSSYERRSHDRSTHASAGVACLSEIP